MFLLGLGIIFLLVLCGMSLYVAFEFPAQTWLWLLIFALAVRLLMMTFYYHEAQIEILRLNSLLAQQKYQGGQQ